MTRRLVPLLTVGPVAVVVAVRVLRDLRQIAADMVSSFDHDFTGDRPTLALVEPERDELDEALQIPNDDNGLCGNANCRLCYPNVTPIRDAQ